MSTNGVRKHRVGVISALVLVSLCIGAVSYALIGRGSHLPPRLNAPVGLPADLASEQRLQPRAMSPRDAAAEVLAGVASSGIRAIDVVGSRSESGATSAGVRITVDGADVNSVEAGWLGALAQGAIADLIADDKTLATQDVSAGGELIGVDATGKAAQRTLGIGYVASGQHFEALPDSALRERVRRVAAAFGLEVRAVTILHPLETALWVHLTVPNEGAVKWTIDELADALQGSPKTLEGLCIQLYSSNGDKLLTTAGAYRSGLGGLWFAAGQDDRFGAAHG